MHINRDGSIPRNNPCLGRSTVFAETWAHGFKDPEGLAFNPQSGEYGSWITDRKAETRSTLCAPAATMVSRT